VSAEETFTEWRVTGQPPPYGGTAFPPYDFVWSGDPARGGHAITDEQAEAGARAFMEKFTEEREPWLDGPHLHRRTVTRSAWEPQ
jgi:hypothetical protein